jgi:hypothetical protein
MMRRQVALAVAERRKRQRKEVKRTAKTEQDDQQHLKRKNTLTNKNKYENRKEMVGRMRNERNK